MTTNLSVATTGGTPSRFRDRIMQLCDEHPDSPVIEFETRWTSWGDVSRRSARVGAPRGRPASHRSRRARRARATTRHQRPARAPRRGSADRLDPVTRLRRRALRRHRAAAGRGGRGRNARLGSRWSPRVRRRNRVCRSVAGGTTGRGRVDLGGTEQCAPASRVPARRRRAGADERNDGRAPPPRGHGRGVGPRPHRSHGARSRPDPGGDHRARCRCRRSEDCSASSPPSGGDARSR